MAQKRDPYPLQWPDGWERTINRSIPKFSAENFARIRDRVIRSLRKRGSNVVITSDLPTRGDGLPYADARCKDPGVAVWWVEKGKEMVVACDRWRLLPYNLSAIDRTLEALRGIDRWGAATLVDKAFSGFAALPPPGGTSEGSDVVMAPAMPSWREVFDVATNLSDVLSKADIFNLVKGRYRSMIDRVHPDKAGAHADVNQTVILNAAFEAAQKELT